MTGTLTQLTQQKNKLDENNDFTKRISSSKRWQSLGRFKTIRCGYSIFQSQLQRFNSEFYQQRLNISNLSVISPVQVSQCVDNVRETGVHLGLQLNAKDVEKIRFFADLNLCTEPKHNDSFLASDIKSGHLNGTDRQVMRGLVSNIDIISCAIISPAQTWWNKYYSSDILPIAKIVNQANQPLLLIEKYWRSRGKLYSFSNFLEPKVQIQPLTKGKMTDNIPDSFSNVFVFNPSDILQEKLKESQKYEIQPFYNGDRFQMIEIKKMKNKV